MRRVLVAVKWWQRRKEAKRQRILDVFRSEAPRMLGGADVWRSTGRMWATMTLLHELERNGVIEGMWEGTPPEGRPARKLYRLTERLTDGPV